MISRTVFNFLLDTTLLVITSALLFTGAVLRFVFPAPTAAAGWTLWGQGYDAWANFQFMLLAAIALAILLHVMMHWSWVCGVVITRLLRRSAREANVDDGSRTLWGVGMLIVLVNLIGALVGLAYLMIQGPGS